MERNHPTEKATLAWTPPETIGWDPGKASADRIPPKIKKTTWLSQIKQELSPLGIDPYDLTQVTSLANDRSLESHGAARNVAWRKAFLIMMILWSQTNTDWNLTINPDLYLYHLSYLSVSHTAPNLSVALLHLTYILLSFCLHPDNGFFSMQNIWLVSKI